MTQVIRVESLRGYVNLVESLGGDATSILSLFDLTPQRLEESWSLIPYRTFVNLLEASAEILECPDFGLRFSQNQDINILGPIALAAQQAVTLRESLQRLANYLPAYSSAISFHINELPGDDEIVANINFLLDPMPSCKQAVEITIALECQIAGFLSGGVSQPVKILLPHGKFHNSRLYRQIFKCPVEFHQSMSGIVYKKRVLDLPIKTPSQEIGRVASAYLHSQFLTGEESLIQKVNALIKPLLLAKQCDNANMAEALGIHIRKLHRDLELENTSFLKIKETVMQEVAKQYLAEPSFSFSQIADMLGYAEQSGFTRSCQRWFGKSPRSLRKELG